MKKRGSGLLRVALDSDGVHRVHLAAGWTESAGDAHRVEHGVVDVETFGPDVHDLACFEAAVRAGDGVEDARQLALDVVVATVA